MNGGTRITSGGGRERRREGAMEGKLQNKQGQEDDAAAAFVKRCQIFYPGVLSVLPCNRCV